MMTSTGDSKKAPSDYPNWQPHAGFSTNNYGHEVWGVHNQFDGHNHFPVHRLLAVAEWGVETVKGNIVHHINEIPWDNRVENLELMPPSEHTITHRKGVQETTNEDLLNDLRVGAEVLGFPPRPTDIRHFGEYSPKTYHDRFGSWDQALSAAGLDPQECPNKEDRR